jgi:hypothetical protein
MRPAIYARWRQEWVRQGMKWFSKGTDPPAGWNPIEQLRNIGTA